MSGPQVLTITAKAATNVCVQAFVVRGFSLLLCWYLGVGLLGRVAGVGLVYQKPPHPLLSHSAARHFTAVSGFIGLIRVVELIGAWGAGHVGK